MPRALNWLLILAALAATVALYAISYDTRSLEAKVLAEEHAIEHVNIDIAILRAERAHLARPERLEPLARELGMAPIDSGQYLRIGGAATGPESATAQGGRLTPVDPGSLAPGVGQN
jgi:cell division protein FtsL